MTIYPNDGPLMKWLSAHGKAHVFEREDKRKYDGDLARFRKARDYNQPHGILIHKLVFDGPMLAKLELGEGRRRYMTSLTFENEQITLRETRNANKFLSIDTDQQMPTIMVQSLVGRLGSDVVILPDVLQPIIEGRLITDVKIFGERKVILLDTKRW